LLPKSNNTVKKWTRTQKLVKLNTTKKYTVHLAW